MDNILDYDVIIFDFDGVILESMEFRTNGFSRIFENYSKEKVEELTKYHNENGGLSRFHKIRYFYENILDKEITQNQIDSYVNKFSDLMRKELVKEKYRINDSIEFISKIYSGKKLYIASGSEEVELNYLCKEHNIDNMFLEIYGSPKHKNDIVKYIIETNNYDVDKVCIIGDSKNDLEAAEINKITFFGYNNKALKQAHKNYYENLSSLVN